MSPSILSWSDHKSFLFSGLSNLLKTGYMSDLEIRCGDKEQRSFQVHRVILAIFTDFFKHCDGLWTRVNVNASQMEYVLNFIYAGHIAMNLAEVEPFLATCKHLGIRLFCDQKPTTPTENEEKIELKELDLVCHKCYRCFLDEKLMKKHNWNCGRQQVIYKCKTCPNISQFRVEYKNHELTHTTGLPFTCPTPGCSQSFKLKSLLANHISCKHRKLKYECDSCKKRFHFKSELDCHIKTHENLSRNEEELLKSRERLKRGSNEGESHGSKRLNSLISDEEYDLHIVQIDP